MLEYTLYQEFPPELESEWNDLLSRSANHVPFLRYEYQTAWWQTRGGGEWPDAELVLVTARSEGKLVGAAPLFHTSNHAGQPALLLVGSIEISDYLDFLAEPQDLEPFLSGLLKFLQSEQTASWKSIDLYNILDSSPALKILEDVSAEQGLHCITEVYKHSPMIRLPGDWEHYLAGIDKKQRHEIRRKMRRLEENENIESRWYFVEDEETLDAEGDAFFNLMLMDPDKKVFLTEIMRKTMGQIIRCAFEKQCLKLFFLEIDGKKAAAVLCFDYGNRLWAYNSGFDASMNEYSPGWVLLSYILRWANENRYEAFDFMRGNEKYKYRFGAVDRFVMRQTISR